MLLRVPLIARYVARRMLPWTGAGLATAMILFVATQLVRISPLIAGAGVSLWETVGALALVFVPVFGFALPPAFSVAVFAVGGRMAEDGELVALDAAGVARAAVALGPLSLALALGAASAVIWLVAAPASCQALRDEAIRLAGRGLVGRVSPGRFSEPIPGVTVLANAVDGNALSGVFIADDRDPSAPIQLTAARAVLHIGSEDEASFSLEDGEAFVAIGEGRAPAEIRFASLALGSPVANGAATDAFLPALLGTDTSSLLGPPPEGVDPDAWGFALWRRLAGPLGFLALALSSTALAFGIPWRRRGLAVACAVALFSAFHVVGRLAEQLLSERAMNPAAAALAPGFAVVALSALLLVLLRTARNRSSVVQKG